jgi:hypothetical protein
MERPFKKQAEKIAYAWGIGPASEFIERMLTLEAKVDQLETAARRAPETAAFGPAQSKRKFETR